jgi:hypothetical protein
MMGDTKNDNASYSSGEIEGVLSAVWRIAARAEAAEAECERLRVERDTALDEQYRLANNAEVAEACAAGMCDLYNRQSDMLDTAKDERDAALAEAKRLKAEIDRLRDGLLRLQDGMDDRTAEQVQALIDNVEYTEDDDDLG